MEQSKGIRTGRKGKHLTREERIMIETMLKNAHQPKEVSIFLGKSRRCIEREIKRGKVENLNTDLTKKKVYSSDRGQDVYDLNATAKGPQLKLGKNYELVDFVSRKILDDKCSPDVVAHLMKAQGMSGAVCTKTLYSYVEQGLIPGVSNGSLWEKGERTKRKKSPVKRLKKQHARRTGIEKRPRQIEERKEFGHWEIDLVEGGKRTSKPVLLTLLERKTRKVIIRKLPDKTQASVLKALRSIEGSMGPNKFRALFKSITADNGSEFLDVEQMERSAFSNKMRVKMYYAHPYSSWERGSNENANRMIRRFIAKGVDIGKLLLKRIQWIQNWINNYARKILDYQTAEECFNLELAA